MKKEGKKINPFILLIGGWKHGRKKKTQRQFKNKKTKQKTETIKGWNFLFALQNKWYKRRKPRSVRNQLIS